MSRALSEPGGAQRKLQGRKPESSSRRTDRAGKASTPRPALPPAGGHLPLPGCDSTCHTGAQRTGGGTGAGEWSLSCTGSESARASDQGSLSQDPSGGGTSVNTCGRQVRTPVRQAAFTSPCGHQPGFQWEHSQQPRCGRQGCSPGSGRSAPERVPESTRHSAGQRLILGPDVTGLKEGLDCHSSFSLSLFPNTVKTFP